LNLDGSMTVQIMLLQAACSRHEMAFVAKHAGVPAAPQVHETVSQGITGHHSLLNFQPRDKGTGA
jgi:hypothetical protein